MNRDIRTFYFMLALPALCAAAVFFGLDLLGIDFRWGPVSRSGAAALVFLAGFLAVALPIWLRVFFVRRIRARKAVSPAEFAKFEKRLIFFAQLSLYVVLLADRLQVERMPMLLIALAGFYAAYYYYPSERRIAFEKKLFRVLP